MSHITLYAEFLPTSNDERIENQETSTIPEQLQRFGAVLRKMIEPEFYWQKIHAS